MEDTFLGVADVARRLGIVPARVRQLVAEGKLPVAIRTVSGVRIFRLRDVEHLQCKRHQEKAPKACRYKEDQADDEQVPLR